MSRVSANVTVWLLLLLLLTLTVAATLVDRSCLSNRASRSHG
jgi:hypothetical protein